MLLWLPAVRPRPSFRPRLLAFVSPLRIQKRRLEHDKYFFLQVFLYAIKVSHTHDVKGAHTCQVSSSVPSGHSINLPPQTPPGDNGNVVNQNSLPSRRQASVQWSLGAETSRIKNIQEDTHTHTSTDTSPISLGKVSKNVKM